MCLFGVFDRCVCLVCLIGVFDRCVCLVRLFGVFVYQYCFAIFFVTTISGWVFLLVVKSKQFASIRSTERSYYEIQC